MSSSVTFYALDDDGNIRRQTVGENSEVITLEELIEDTNKFIDELEDTLMELKLKRQIIMKIFKVR